MTKPVCSQAVLVRRRNLKNDYHSLIFEPFAPSSEPRPGQFLHIKLPGSTVYFRRAFSVAAVPDKSRVEIILKVFGRGSALMSRLRPGDAVDILGPLGNGFKEPPRTTSPLIVAGGVGFPPLLFLAARMVAGGFDPKLIHFFYGGRTTADIIQRSRIKKLGVQFHAVTEDGSFGRRGAGHGGGRGLGESKSKQKIPPVRLRSGRHAQGC
ncbi:MAG: FAD-binding oxidoreductase [bacterium]